MTIRYKCEECGSVLNIKDEKAGTAGRCPKCKAEFVVPSPDAKEPVAAAVDGPTETTTGAPDSDHELSAQAVSGPKGGSENLSDDEIEKLLETREAGPPRDDYSVSSGVDEPYDEDDESADYESSPTPASRFGLPEEEPQAPARARGSDTGERPRKKPRPRREADEPARPTVSAAGIAEGLMARGDNPVKHEVVERKAGRPFGGDDRRGTDEEGFSVGEVVRYFARYAVPVLLGLTLSFGLYYWWYSGWVRGELPPLAPVSGTVTLDGAPLAKAEIHFHPLNPDPKNLQNLKKASSSVGFTDADGKFTLVYSSRAAGAVIGKHRVQIFANDDQGRPIIPSRYNSASTLSAEVKKEGGGPYNFELTSKDEKDSSGAKGGFAPPSR